ncbi:MAG: photosystem reaction center subunit H [Alphaproteobacteria bacterium MedPE-SWcel]|nr:MAG: photosystem reaction center subunit H [Alphaproteobacteria bacterium MedPE-SWcel]
MKNLLISTALLTATSTMAFAETAMFRAEADPTSIHASEFIGQRIYRSETNVDSDTFAGVQGDWEDIGEVNDIVLSRDGDIESVLVDIGGFLGIGERQVAVEMDALKLVSDSETEDDTSDYFLVMQAKAADFENAPAYETNAGHNLGASLEQAASDTATAVENTAKTLQGSAETAASDMGTALDNTAADAERLIAGDTARTHEPMMRDGYDLVGNKDLTAEMLTGARAYDVKDEWMGEVSDLILNDKGQITHAIIDVGGFLGLGEKPVKLDLNEIDILHETAGDDVRVYVPMAEDKLDAMPAYEG